MLSVRPDDQGGARRGPLPRAHGDRSPTIARAPSAFVVEWTRGARKRSPGVANFLELRKSEVRHDPGPAGPDRRIPDRGYAISCKRTSELSAKANFAEYPFHALR